MDSRALGRFCIEHFETYDDNLRFLDYHSLIRCRQCSRDIIRHKVFKLLFDNANMPAIKWQETFFFKDIINNHELTICYHKLDKKTILILGHGTQCPGCLMVPKHVRTPECQCCLCMNKSG